MDEGGDIVCVGGVCVCVCVCFNVRDMNIFMVYSEGAS